MQGVRKGGGGRQCGETKIKEMDKGRRNKDSTASEGDGKEGTRGERT